MPKAATKAKAGQEDQSQDPREVREKDDPANPTQGVIDVLIDIVAREMQPPARMRLLGRALDGVGNAVRMETCRVFGIEYGVASSADDLLGFVFDDPALIEGRLAILFASPTIRDRMASYFKGHQRLDAAVLRERQASA